MYCRVNGLIFCISDKIFKGIDSNPKKNEFDKIYRNTPLIYFKKRVIKIFNLVYKFYEECRVKFRSFQYHKRIFELNPDSALEIYSNLILLQNQALTPFFLYRKTMYSFIKKSP